MSKEICVPDIGDFSEVEVIEILVSVGDTIEAEDSLISVESDKAAMEIPAPEAGVVKEIKVNIGDKVAEGSPILMLEPLAAGSSAGSKPKETSVEKTAKPAIETPEKTPLAKPVAAAKKSPTANIDAVSFSKAHASPSVRKFARELGVDLGQVEGTGRKKRITRADVKGFVKRALSQGTAGTGLGIAPMPEIDFSQWGEIESKPLTKINKLTGQFLHRNWV
ncbi:MAG TPA: branched-chain alpha-keto acid dehydrogenase subunit E2, partial [Gammaproteobacteria bacterium]|nr:branched-chain alpha-keto acid dehydrogenase subunit E2 [Gammaproteobacteria bacterium]